MLELFFGDLHLLIEIHVDDAVLDFALRVCVSFTRSINDHLPGLLVLAELVDELISFYRVKGRIRRQAPDSCGVVSVVDDVLVTEHLTETQLGESHGGVEVRLGFDDAPLDRALFPLLLRRSKQDSLLRFVIFSLGLFLLLASDSLHLKLSFLDDVDEKTSFSLAVHCLVALVVFLAKREAQPADLSARPVAQARNLQQEVDLLLLRLYFKFLEELLVELTAQHCKVALVNRGDRCSSWLVVYQGLLSETAAWPNLFDFDEPLQL